MFENFDEHLRNMYLIYRFYEGKAESVITNRWRGIFPRRKKRYIARIVSLSEGFRGTRLAYRRMRRIKTN